MLVHYMGANMNIINLYCEVANYLTLHELIKTV